jgi:hypothetical protein
MRHSRKNLSEERQKKENPNIMSIFGKYLLPENTRLRLIEKVDSCDIYIFQTPNKRYYIIPAHQFKDLFKGPTISRIFHEENLEVDHIYTLTNTQFGSQLVEYRKKLTEKEIYVFEDSNGITYSIISDDIVANILPESMEYKIVVSGNFFDV